MIRLLKNKSNLAHRGVAGSEWLKCIVESSKDEGKRIRQPSSFFSLPSMNQEPLRAGVNSALINIYAFHSILDLFE